MTISEASDVRYRDREIGELLLEDSWGELVLAWLAFEGPEPARAATDLLLDALVLAETAVVRPRADLDEVLLFLAALSRGKASR